MVAAVEIVAARVEIVEGRVADRVVVRVADRVVVRVVVPAIARVVAAPSRKPSPRA